MLECVFLVVLGDVGGGIGDVVIAVGGGVGVMCCCLVGMVVFVVVGVEGCGEGGCVWEEAGCRRGGVVGVAVAVAAVFVGVGVGGGEGVED